MYYRVLVLCVLFRWAWCLTNWNFPPQFKFGVATAAYQVEGAWNVSDKGESIWDRLLHTQSNLSLDGSNGDVACDSYHLWKRDIQMAKDLGVDIYRFSISWPRLLPSGFANHISSDGAAYYNNLIDGLLAEGIEPVVTLYHWDLPQYLQDLGKVSLCNIFFWFEPETPSDQEVTDLMIQMWQGRFAHPIYSPNGGWPPQLEKVLNENGKREGYPYPRLPPLSEEETNLIRGTYDFYALNHYTTRLVRKVPSGTNLAWVFSGNDEISAAEVNDPSWSTAVTDWFAINPEGLRKQLHWINRTYGVSEVLITENGLPSLEKHLYDQSRIAYIRSNLEQVLLAIEDGLTVLGYTAWSLMDNYEWLSGYAVSYGLYSVDFSSPQRTRTPRESARYYANLTRSRSLQSTERHLLDYI